MALNHGGWQGLLPSTHHPPRSCPPGAAAVGLLACSCHGVAASAAQAKSGRREESLKRVIEDAKEMQLRVEFTQHACKA